MGLARSAAKVLVRESARRPFSGTVLTLGRQNIYFTYRDLERIVREEGVALKGPRPRDVKATDRVQDADFFSAIGFDRHESLDVSDFEQASIIYDLNSPELPDDLKNTFDVIVDSGTIEHIFHVPNVLKNLHSMLTVGGRVIHMAPASNQVDHGFYMFSPTLFWDFYSVNGMQLEHFKMYRYSPRHENARWKVSDYSPGALDRIGAGGLDAGMYGTICIATKTPESTGDAVPQQGAYLKAWGTSSASQGNAAAADEPRGQGSPVERVKQVLRRHPSLHEALYKADRYRRVASPLKRFRLRGERY